MYTRMFGKEFFMTPEGWIIFSQSIYGYYFVLVTSFALVVVVSRTKAYFINKRLESVVESINFYLDSLEAILSAEVRDQTTTFNLSLGSKIEHLMKLWDCDKNRFVEKVAEIHAKDPRIFNYYRGIRESMNFLKDMPNVELGTDILTRNQTLRINTVLAPSVYSALDKYYICLSTCDIGNITFGTSDVTLYPDGTVYSDGNPKNDDDMKTRPENH